MSETGLPSRVEPGKYAEQEKTLQGRVAISDLTRLHGYLADLKGFLDLDLSFYKDPENIRVMSGTCRGQVQMTCERCLEPCEVDVDSEFALGFVFNDDQAKHLPKHYEPAYMDENGAVELLPLIEDEAILALPMYANHPEGVCELVLPVQDAEEQEPVAEKDNPFSVLSQLKKD